jgi:hypothetical protein
MLVQIHALPWVYKLPGLISNTYQYVFYIHEVVNGKSNRKSFTVAFNTHASE